MAKAQHFFPCLMLRPPSSKCTYLSDHFISYINVGFLRKRNHHVVDVVPGLGPHVSCGRGRTHLGNNPNLLRDALLQAAVGNASIRVVR